MQPLQLFNCKKEAGESPAVCKAVVSGSEGPWDLGGQDGGSAECGRPGGPDPSSVVTVGPAVDSARISTKTQTFGKSSSDMGPGVFCSVFDARHVKEDSTYTLQ